MKRPQSSSLHRIAIFGAAVILTLAGSRLPAQAQPAPAADDPPLPVIGEMELPPPAKLLEAAFDWIVLKDERVIVALPVYPRPGTLAKLEEKSEALRKLPVPRDPGERRKLEDEIESLEYIIVQLPGEETLYRLKRELVENVIHYEDHLLQQAARLTEAKKFREAFELLFLLARRDPNWPGLPEAQQGLLFAQAADHFESDRHERALAVLEDLHGRNPEYPELSRQLGRVVEAIIAPAADEEDFRRARHFLERLTNVEPQHATAMKWRVEFEGRAQTLFDAALAASDAGRHAEAAAEVARAAEIWPRLTGLRPAFERMLRRFQTLRVGVLRLADDPIPTSPVATAPQPERAARANILAGSPAARHAKLTTSRLFQPGRVDRITRFDTDHFELWEPTDLGRRVEFFLRQGRPAWDPQATLSAADVVRELQARLDERSPRFDERLAGFVESATLNGPHRFEVRFRRIPLRPEPLLSIPVAAEAEDGGHAPAGPFRSHAQRDDALVYRRARDEPEDLQRFHVAEIIERRYDSHDQAMQALLRGEVDALPAVQPWDVPVLRKDENLVVRQSSVPTTHVVQFHPDSAALKNGELRRALSFAIDRERILRSTVLRGAPAEFGRVVTAPFSTRSFAYDALVAPRQPDRTLAYTLAFSAGRRIEGGVPKLRLACVPDPLARAAAERLVEEWQRVGIEVELLDADTATVDDGWDLVYRTVRMTDPLTELWPFLTLDPQARIAGLSALPDWLRQEVIDLEYAADWKTAEDRLRRVHRHLAADATLIPLWEVEEYQVARRAVRRSPGASEQPFSPYDGIEQWIVDPSYPTDKP
ncbi:MAG: ABC transporter substrate-binding protein [Planctomycetaceae bacterium]